jgi:putative DNA primase/helicase
LRERGYFAQPESGKEIMEAMESLASPVKAFVSERCEVRPGAQATIDAVYNAWRGWCDENGRRPGTKQVFGRNLQAAVQGVVPRQPTIDGKRVRVYEGLEVKPVQGKVNDTTDPM